jgi:hypothetical protein
MKTPFARFGPAIALAIVAVFAARVGIGSRTHAAQSPGAPPATNDWLVGTADDKFATVGKQLRGLDVAMVEMGYRYTELYWAGQDKNWAFAEYQVDKIRLALELSLERRPKRAASAQSFLTNALPAVKEAVLKKDPALFKERFATFTVACNICHVMEKMPFVTVQPPEHRLSPVRFAEK